MVNGSVLDLAKQTLITVINMVNVSITFTKGPPVGKPKSIFILYARSFNMSNVFACIINFNNWLIARQPRCFESSLEQYYGPQCDLFRWGPGFYGALFGSLAGALLLLIIIVTAIVVFKKRHTGVWWVMMLKMHVSRCLKS